jgi:hypothetical protein
MLHTGLKGIGMATTLTLVCATASFAAQITGQVDTQGTASVSGTTITFSNSQPGCASGSNSSTTGCFGVGATPTGSFASLGSTFGTISDLLSGSPTGPRTVVGFMLFQNNVAFDLTNVFAAGLPGCSTVNPTLGGVSCVPDGVGPSAFRLTNGPGTGLNGSGAAASVGVQFTVGLNGYTGLNTSGVTPYIGIFTTQIAGSNAQDILNALGSGGSVTHSYSASFSPTQTPEPGTMLLMGFGLLGVSGLTRKFAKR